jgi:hypothetical protein
VARPRHQDGGADDREALLGSLLPALDERRRAVRNLVAHREEHLLPDQLLRQGARRLDGELVLRVERRSLGRDAEHDVQHRRDVLVPSRARRHQLAAGKEGRHLGHERQQLRARQAVHLVQDDHGGSLAARQLVRQLAVARRDPGADVEHHQCGVDVLEGAPRGLDHAAVEHRRAAWMPGVSTKTAWPACVVRMPRHASRSAASGVTMATFVPTVHSARVLATLAAPRWRRCPRGNPSAVASAGGAAGPPGRHSSCSADVSARTSSASIAAACSAVFLL